MTNRGWVTALVVAGLVPFGVVAPSSLSAAWAGSPGGVETTSNPHNHRPVTPTAADLSTSRPTTSCVTDPARAPHVNIGVNAGIMLSVVARDPDGDQVMASFDFRDAGASTPLAAPVIGPVSSGTPVQAVVVQGLQLTDGATYAWHASVQDVDAGVQVMSSSRNSPDCYLVQDATFPSPPVVSSSDYPTDQLAGGPGVPGVFTFTPGAPTDTDITEYCYGLDTQATPSCVPVAGDLTASVTVTPTSLGPHDLFVRSRDAAGNSSSTTDYHFHVNALPEPVAYWKMNEGAGTTITSVQGDATATLSPSGVSWTADGRINEALTFDGTTGSVSATSVRASTAASFTVAAWVRLGSVDASGTAASQDGVQVSGFSLGYDQTSNRWQFALPTGDTDTATVDRAVSTTGPQPGVWTHLTGVYDASAGQIRLYVDGVQQSAVSHSTAWDAQGTLQLGRAMSQGTPTRFWNGDLDEVQVHPRTMSAAEIASIVAATPTLVGSWSFDEAGGTEAADGSGNGHAATLVPGASFGTDGHTGGGLTLDGLTGSASTSGPVVRTDQSFTVAAWVRLSRDDSTFTIASQDGTNTAGFRLAYEADNGGLWTFGIPPADASGSVAVAPAETLTHDTVDRWVHLVGSYDASTGTCTVRRLDSFGLSFGFGAQRQPWNATGAFQVGTDLTVDGAGNSVHGNNLAGVIDDLRVYTGLLSEEDIRDLEGI